MCPGHVNMVRLLCLRERKLENLLGYDMRSRFFPVEEACMSSHMEIYCIHKLALSAYVATLRTSRRRAGVK